jgi:hypothetical protein
MSAYPPPSENLPIFDSALFSNATDITLDSLKTQFLQFPKAQSGLETIPNLAITSSGTAPTASSSSNDTTIATTAFVKANALSPLSPSPAGTYTNLNATINSYGQITTASNGSSGASVITIRSDATGTNSWSFTNMSSVLSKRAYSYSLYSDLYPSQASKSNLGTTSINYGSIVPSGTFFTATGNMVYQTYTGSSSTQITYCAGFQQNYTYSANGTAYIPSIVNAIGATLSWSVVSSAVGENSGTCPPSASGSFNTIATLTSTTSITNCYVYLLCVAITP